MEYKIVIDKHLHIEFYTQITKLQYLFEKNYKIGIIDVKP